ncbi:hypothetical protein [Virgisporangium aurantiacum]|uniref:hypothetical protein n=1 Tax=Virgisporangium aurantiacum TaxID=175570 RepID=UPI00194E73CD|nr:hypothetical protein [Virgisporangium aurantiacum]
MLKRRRHLFEEFEITLDHPGVVMTIPLDRQYQAMLEVVVADEAELARRGSGRTVRPGTRRVVRCITTKDYGRITLAGVRGVAVADVIRRLAADSQTHQDVLREFLPASRPRSEPGSHRTGMRWRGPAGPRHRPSQLWICHLSQPR